MDLLAGSRGPPDLFHVESDAQYQRLLREEEAYWDACTDSPLSRTQLPRIQRYMNERFTGRTEVEWFQAISEFGPFHRGCVLGAGPGTVENDLLHHNPELTLTILDISKDALGRLRQRLEETVPGRAEVRQEDLNFVDLPDNTYDLVVANSSMHHLVNLEHVGFQINRALTQDGRFFMNDTVGESYFQFDERKKRLFELVNEATSSPWYRRGVDWPDRSAWQFSPFESVRSEEILDVFGSYLREESVRTAWSLAAAMLFSIDAMPPRTGLLNRLLERLRRRILRPHEAQEPARLRATGELLIELDRILSDTSYMKPGLAFAIYRKRG